MNAWRAVRRHYTTDPEAGREAAAQLLADLYGYNTLEDLDDARARLRDGLGHHYEPNEERAVLARLGLLDLEGNA